MEEVSVLTTGAGIEVDLTEGLRELLLQAGAALVGVGDLKVLENVATIQECLLRFRCPNMLSVTCRRRRQKNITNCMIF